MSQKARTGVLIGSLLTVCLLGTPALAQQPGGAPATSGPRFGAEIALVDIDYVFKNFRVVKAIQNDLQADEEKVQAGWKNDLDAIKKLQEKLPEFRAGSPEYKDLEDRIVRLQADYTARRTVMTKELRGQRMKMLCRVYQQIKDEVDSFASANGVVAVFQFNREVMDPEKPESVQGGLMNPVLWHHRNLDISQYILQSLERRYGTQQTGAVNPRFPTSNSPTNGPGVQR